MEHLGSLALGMEFVEQTIRILKPGGVAVHTTEFNVSSSDKTLETGTSVIYRKSDLLQLQEKIKHRSAILHDLTFDPGTSEFDTDYDIPPYYTSGSQHIKLLLDGFVTTSILLVITRDL